MVKISKIKLSPNIKRLKYDKPKPKFLSAIKLAQFSGVEVSERPKITQIKENLSLFQLQQKLALTSNNINEIIKKLIPNVKLSGKSVLLDLKEKNITQNALNQLKIERLLHKNYLNNILTLFSNNKIPYLNKLCSEIPVKQNFTIINDSILMSPRLLIHYIKGENTISHYANVKNLKKIFSSCKVEELFRMKRKILNELCEYTSTDSLIPDYKFPKSKIKKLKSLAEKYDAIDDLLKHHNIHTSAIETLFYGGMNKCPKTGDILPNKDIMLGFSNIYDRHLKKDIPVILSFANTDVGYRFKAFRYDEALISNIEKYKKQVLHNIKTKNYRSINDLDNKILEYLKNIEVSEVYVTPKDLSGLRKEMERCPDLTTEKIEQILKNIKNDTVYYIQNLKNYNLKRYYNVSNPLIKCLKEFGKINNINEVYTEAFAFNNVRHSPIWMYIRNGFKPISIPLEEIEKSLYLKGGFDCEKSVWLVYKM